jgi:hypothetical protein
LNLWFFGDPDGFNEYLPQRDSEITNTLPAQTVVVLAARWDGNLSRARHNEVPQNYEI